MTTRLTYLRLEVISGRATGETLVVEDELVIGRHAEGPGRLSDDEELSRRHARISREATGDYAIEDLGSSNGTFINGLRIQSPRLLALGDSIEAGATTLVVKAIVQPEPVEAPPAAPSPPASDRSSTTVFAQDPVTPLATAVPAQEIAPPAGPADRPAIVAVAAEPAGVAPPVLRLEIDFDAREARLALGEDGEAVNLVFVDGVWRAGS